MRNYCKHFVKNVNNLFTNLKQFVNMKIPFFTGFLNFLIFVFAVCTVIGLYYKGEGRIFWDVNE
jgi:hypothetical protein